jgi:hypothetical protein
VLPFQQVVQLMLYGQQQLSEKVHYIFSLVVVVVVVVAVVATEDISNASYNTTQTITRILE